MPRKRDARHPTDKRRLTKDDWTAAALEALETEGLSAVAIEPLAARLGATKGSAYWHFKNRDALLHATLERWEADDTERVIAAVEQEAADGDSGDRLRVLFTAVLEQSSANTPELALIAAADDPVIAPVVERVTERRLGYIAQLLRGQGYAPAEARRRALAAYSTYLGHVQLARTSPSALPKGRALRAYVELLVDVLTGPQPE